MASGYIFADHEDPFPALAERRFDGKTFKLRHTYKGKYLAKIEAAERRRTGYKARLVKIRGGYALYTRR